MSIELSGPDGSLTIKAVTSVTSEYVSEILIACWVISGLLDTRRDWSNCLTVR